MAVNTVVGFLFRQFHMGGVDPDAFDFFLVCAPIVVVGAPLGSVIGSHFHRLVLAAFVYVTDFVQFIGALVVVQPWTTKKTTQPVLLSCLSFGIVIVGVGMFRMFTMFGMRLMQQVEKANAADAAAKAKAPESQNAKANQGDGNDKTTVAFNTVEKELGA
jgi:hypothetical protein